jgi:glutaredoxin
MNVVIYTKENCSFCTNTKTLLATKGIGYTEMKLNEDFTREYLVENYPSAKSFPLIIIDGFYIGGYEQLKNKLNESSDTTQKLLNEGNVA